MIDNPQLSITNAAARLLAAAAESLDHHLRHVPGLTVGPADTKCTILPISSEQTFCEQLVDGRDARAFIASDSLENRVFRAQSGVFPHGPKNTFTFGAPAFWPTKNATSRGIVSAMALKIIGVLLSRTPPEIREHVVPTRAIKVPTHHLFWARTDKGIEHEPVHSASSIDAIRARQEHHRISPWLGAWRDFSENASNNNDAAIAHERIVCPGHSSPTLAHSL